LLPRYTRAPYNDALPISLSPRSSDRIGHEGDLGPGDEPGGAAVRPFPSRLPDLDRGGGAAGPGGRLLGHRGRQSDQCVARGAAGLIGSGSVLGCLPPLLPPLTRLTRPPAPSRTSPTSTVS